ncbi:MAG: ABC transporter substrate-binding protein, partial [Gammaproteobacteria bacterium]|nr:ABC transporter substrate-binding protein [Gammaproteobacteria bacterium]
MPPLTGLAELYGPEISRAGKVACDEINEQGGILGHKLELIIEDDGSLPETAVPAAKKLIEDHGCVAIIGNLLSNSRISVANHVADKFRIPFLNFSFYEGSISSRYFFHFAALPNQQIEMMIPYMAERFGPKMFFAGNNYEWPRGSIDACKKSLLNLGGEIVGEEYFEIGTDNFDDLLTQVGNSGADVFVPYAAGNDQIKLLNSFTERGLKKRMAVVMGHYDEVMMMALSPEVREGFFSSNTYFMSIDSDENRKVLSRMEKYPDVTGIWPNGNGALTNFGEGTYLCVHAFAKAANLAGSLDSEVLLEALENIEVKGPQGTVIMDSETHHAAVNSYLSECQRDGTFKIIKSFGRIKGEIPSRYKGDFDNKEIKTEINNYQSNEIKGRELVGVVEKTDEHRFEVIKSFSGFGQEILTEAAMLELMALIQSQGKILEISGNKREEVKLIPVMPLEHLEFDVIAVPLLNKGLCTNFAIYIETNSAGEKTNGYLDKTRNMVSLVSSDNNLGELSDAILAMADSAIIAANKNGIIIQANNMASQLFGYTKEEMVGLEIHLLLPPHIREQHKMYYNNFVESELISMSMGEKNGITGYRKDGSFFPAESNIAKIQGNDDVILVVTLRDITKHKQEEEKLLWKATHDPLTSLPNRALIKDRLTNALARSKRTGLMVALMFIDLDQFKLINDSCGHEAGDHLLIDIASRLVEVVRPGDTVARFGGDEFIILCDQISEEDDLKHLIERIIENVKQPVDIDGSVFYPTVSIGIAGGNGNEVTGEQLLQNADTAMYIAKEQGRDGWKIYDNEIGENTRLHVRIASGLRKAVENNELEAYYQPIVDTNTLEIIGSEALLRWNHEGEMISPAQFIPVAEMTGSIVELGFWVFEEACRQQAILRNYFTDEEMPYISVNLSARQLVQHNLIERFEEIIKKYNASTRHLVIEVTESTLMINIDRSLELLQKMGEIGLSLAIDDF